MITPALRERLRAWWIIHTTPAQDRVIYALMQGYTFALDVARQGHVNVGTVYAVLDRLEHLEVVVSALEHPHPPDRPARRTYAVVPHLASMLVDPVSSARAQRYAQALAIFSE